MTKVILNKEDPFVLAIRGCRKIHKVYLYTAHATIGDNRLQWTVELVELVQSAGGTMVNNLFAVLLRDAVNSWDDKLVGVVHGILNTH